METPQLVQFFQQSLLFSWFMKQFDRMKQARVLPELINRVVSVTAPHIHNCCFLVHHLKVFRRLADEEKGGWKRRFHVDCSEGVRHQAEVVHRSAGQVPEIWHHQCHTVFAVEPLQAPIEVHSGNTMIGSPICREARRFCPMPVATFIEYVWRSLIAVVLQVHPNFCRVHFWQDQLIVEDLVISYPHVSVISRMLHRRLCYEYVHEMSTVLHSVTASHVVSEAVLWSIEGDIWKHRRVELSQKRRVIIQGAVEHNDEKNSRALFPGRNWPSWAQFMTRSYKVSIVLTTRCITDIETRLGLCHRLRLRFLCYVVHLCGLCLSLRSSCRYRCGSGRLSQWTRCRTTRFALRSSRSCWLKLLRRIFCLRLCSPRGTTRSRGRSLERDFASRGAKHCRLWYAISWAPAECCWASSSWRPRRVSCRRLGFEDFRPCGSGWLSLSPQVTIAKAPIGKEEHEQPKRESQETDYQAFGAHRHSTQRDCRPAAAALAA